MLAKVMRCTLHATYNAALLPQVRNRSQKDGWVDGWMDVKRPGVTMHKEGEDRTRPGKLVSHF